MMGGSHGCCQQAGLLPSTPSTPQLVFSDEFNQAGRNMAVGEADPRWTADRMWYAGTFDMEVYEPEQVRIVLLGGVACSGGGGHSKDNLSARLAQITTADGAAVITMEKGAGWGPIQRDNGTVWNVTQQYKSGFMHSWNKVGWGKA